MFSYLGAKHNSVMVFDPAEPDIDMKEFPKEDWLATPYGDTHEDIPTNALPPKGVGFTMRALVDSDYAGELVTGRSRTRFIIYLNGAPIYWFSKKQTIVETSSFGSKFIAMKQCCEYVRGLRDKLRMMGIPVEGPTYVFGDNKSVLVNSSKHHSQLKKKSCSIAYHFVQKGFAQDEWRVTCLNTHHNQADIFTKCLPASQKRTYLIGHILHYIT